MDVELCTELQHVLRAMATDPVPAVVLTGTGRSFSAGVDLRRIVEGGEGYVREFLPALSGMFAAAFDLGVPLVAAVNGHAIAGGCVLAAAADVVLMADGKAGIGLPELKVGVPFPRIALEIMRDRLGPVAARRLVTRAQTLTAAQAAEIGLVDEVVPGDELDARALAAADELRTLTPADTFAATKAALRRDARERVAHGADSPWAVDDAAVTEIWIRHATDGTIAAFVESIGTR